MTAIPMATKMRGATNAQNSAPKRSASAIFSTLPLGYVRALRKFTGKSGPGSRRCVVRFDATRAENPGHSQC